MGSATETERSKPATKTFRPNELGRDWQSRREGDQPYTMDRINNSAGWNSWQIHHNNNSRNRQAHPACKTISLRQTLVQPRPENTAVRVQQKPKSGEATTQPPKPYTRTRCGSAGYGLEQ
ncbi:hypothetical protein I7I53_02052 [Histoplasma capsulatum var. duboisii H88]|uniref:Uncharacterized protein n=1 Tax=Ajellomyces capsulatus (strain H88) TaxID=544711 RepID=A0A8A1LKF6_AJEC8|nr:hypothetical protein I7I53_02052 [Histoplasma capsulatum var. duboisii H88]